MTKHVRNSAKGRGDDRRPPDFSGAPAQLRPRSGDANRERDKTAQTARPVAETDPPAGMPERQNPGPDAPFGTEIAISVNGRVHHRQFDAEGRLLSLQGNPYPPGLTPQFVLELLRPGQNWKRMWPHPLGEPDRPYDHSGTVVADYVHKKPDPRFPPFKLRLSPRRPGETDDQYDCHRRTMESHTLAHSAYLWFMQELCTHVGNHRRCAHGLCRRAGRCVTRRDEDYHWLPLAVFPPCIPMDPDIIETYRVEVREEMDRIRSRARGRGAPGTARARPEGERRQGETRVRRAAARFPPHDGERAGREEGRTKKISRRECAAPCPAAPSGPCRSCRRWPRRSRDSGCRRTASPRRSSTASRRP